MPKRTATSGAAGEPSQKKLKTDTIAADEASKFITRANARQSKSPVTKRGRSKSPSRFQPTRHASVSPQAPEPKRSAPKNPAKDTTATAKKAAPKRGLSPARTKEVVEEGRKYIERKVDNTDEPTTRRTRAWKRSRSPAPATETKRPTATKKAAAPAAKKAAPKKAAPKKATPKKAAPKKRGLSPARTKEVVEEGRKYIERTVDNADDPTTKRTRSKQRSRSPAPPPQSAAERRKKPPTPEKTKSATTKKASTPKKDTPSRGLSPARTKEVVEEGRKFVERAVDNADEPTTRRTRAKKRSRSPAPPPETASKKRAVAKKQAAKAAPKKAAPKAAASKDKEPEIGSGRLTVDDHLAEEAAQYIEKANRRQSKSPSRRGRSKSPTRAMPTRKAARKAEH